jgi:ionotropic glutamate receptor
MSKTCKKKHLDFYRSKLTENDMSEQKYDAVVGDVTITAKRMEIVDFTVSFKESGLVVVIAVQSSHSSYPWAFLRPFSPAMWCTTLAFFIFTGIVIWLLEHKKNRDFQGHPTKQVVISLW